MRYLILVSVALAVVLGATADGDVGDLPLYLSSLIAKGQIEEVQKKAAVDNLGVTSYSGYLTVDREKNSNLFFWFFPARNNPEAAPLLLWLQGGPGSSSLFGIFVEHGPFSVNANNQLHLRNHTWVDNHSIIYMDNPVGTGFSFTDDEENGYSTKQSQIDDNLYIAMTQFFQLFPQYQQNDFYVTGESYGGKYVPSLCVKIHDENRKSDQKINLKGMAVGNAFTDPLNLLDYGDLLYENGLIEEEDLDHIKIRIQILKEFAKHNEWHKASNIVDELIGGDLIQGKSHFFNATGYDFYFNMLRTKFPEDWHYYEHYVQQPHVQKALHVGNKTHQDFSKTVFEKLGHDFLLSVKPAVEKLLSNGYRIMFYNGLLDIIVPFRPTSRFHAALEWPGREAFLGAKRVVWMVGDDIAGYIKSGGNLTQVAVRNAGHMVPYDQPEWAARMMEKFTMSK